MGTKIKTVPASEELYEMLKVRYAFPSWALLPQVANGTGYRAYRWADAIGICCWPSLGMDVLGFEIKVHRGDFLGEIRNGAKSDAIFKYCDRWWLVAATEDIVKPGELPSPWGLLVPKGRGLHVVKEAPELKPKKLDKTFIASVLRNAMEVSVPEARLKAEYERGKEEAKKDAEKNEAYKVTLIKEELEALKGSIAAFEKGSGLKWPYTSGYGKDFSNHEEFGKAVDLVLSGDYMRLRKQLERLRDTAKSIAEAVEKSLSGKP